MSFSLGTHIASPTDFIYRYVYNSLKETFVLRMTSVYHDAGCSLAANALWYVISHVHEAAKVDIVVLTPSGVIDLFILDSEDSSSSPNFIHRIADSSISNFSGPRKKYPEFFLEYGYSQSFESLKRAALDYLDGGCAQIRTVVAFDLDYPSLEGAAYISIWRLKTWEEADGEVHGGIDPETSVEHVVSKLSALLEIDVRLIITQAFRDANNQPIADPESFLKLTLEDFGYDKEVGEKKVTITNKALCDILDRAKELHERSQMPAGKALRTNHRESVNALNAKEGGGKGRVMKRKSASKDGGGEGRASKEKRASKQDKDDESKKGGKARYSLRSSSN